MKIKAILSMLILSGLSTIQAIDMISVPEYATQVTLGTGSLHGLVYLSSGIGLTDTDTTLNINLMGCPLGGGIDLNGGTLALDADLHCGSGFLFSSSGNIDGKDQSMICDGNAEISGVVKIVSDLTLDGQGHRLDFAVGGKLEVNDGVTLTLCNVVIDNQNVADFAVCLGSDSSIVLDGVQLALSNDFCFEEGSLLIHDASLKGAGRFVFASGQTSFIAEYGLLSVSDGATLHFDAKGLVINRELLKGQSDTAVLMLNSATLSSDAPALIYGQGMIALDNDVTFSIAGETATTGMSLVAENTEATLKVLAAANVTLKGYLKTDA